MELITSPFQPTFDEFTRTANTSYTICSPFITRKPIEALVGSVLQRGLERTIKVEVLTNISTKSLIDGVTDVAALCFLQESLANVTITYLPRLHAKVYIADDSLAVVTSANYTDGGAKTNFEYGVRTSDPKTIERIRRDVAVYWAFGSEVSPARLRGLRERVGPLRESVREAKRSINRAVQEASHEFREFARQEELERQTENELIRIRVEKRSINAIFSDSVLYLLANGPLTTTALQTQIQQVHPDLCDSAVDRVIDGVHYGKKWKHQVRNAQVGLRRTNRIALESTTGKWRLLNKD